MSQRFNTVIQLLSAALIFGCLAVDVAVAQTTNQAVPVAAESNHKIRFDNESVRVYEVFLEKGKSTLMHEHLVDSFTVFFTNSEISVETYGSKAAVVKRDAGAVGFASTAAGPYSHRLTSIGDTPFHVMAMQLQSPAPKGPIPANLRPASTSKLLLENARGRVYRITLEPGAVTERFNRMASSMLFAISSGRISENISGKPTVDGLPERIWDFEPGSLRWSGTNNMLSMKNESSTPIELVEIEVF